MRRAAAPLASLLAATAVVGVVALVDPNEPGHYPTCPFLAATGQFCPGCGSLRALHALAHGDIAEAAARNPLLVAAVPLIVALWLLWIRRSVTGRARSWAAPGWWLWSLLGVVIAYWVLRNIPGFAWLAP